MINQVIIEGFVTRKEFNFTNNEIAVLKLNLASYKNLSKEKKEELKKQNKSVVDYVNCVAFGKMATAIENFIAENSRITVVGSLNISRYVDDAGTNRYITQVIISQVSFSGNSNNQAEKVVNNDLIDELGIKFDESGMPIVDF
ncbi:single-stranded DNA-binding protein [Peptoniphilaceae bacterium SGI.131]